MQAAFTRHVAAPVSWWLSRPLTSVTDDVGIVELTVPAKLAFVLGSGTHMCLISKTMC